MRALVWGGGRFRRIVLVVGFGVWGLSAAPGKAGDGAGECPTCHKAHRGHHKQTMPAAGTLGYGPPGVFPGFQGFGLGYHPGYGYGGQALGPGADGGYPFYGGPGYPHPWPVLRRGCGINPFPYFGGPGGPCPGGPNYFGGVGPLAPDQPVITVEADPRDPAYASDYGGFTGMIPYPETTFAPFVTIAGATGSLGGVSSASPPNASPNLSPAPGEMLDEHAAARTLGVDAEPVAGAGRERGLKVTRVYPGSAAERAGLQIGDLIRSANGHVTELPGNLTWILANAAPDRVLKMSVRSASDGAVRTITARIP